MIKQRHLAGWYILLALLLLILGLIGFVGYLLYPRFDLPLVSSISLLLLAGAAGTASFFSPCSFPLLATLLAREIGVDKPGHGSVGRAVKFGFALALGASLFLLLTGIGIAIGAAVFFESVTFTSTQGRILRIAVGMLLVILGLVQWQVLSLPFDKLAQFARPIQKQQARLRQEHPVVGFGLLGFGYVLAGFG
jgi:cytochrome c biogenesis protein CcdA